MTGQASRQTGLKSPLAPAMLFPVGARIYWIRPNRPEQPDQEKAAVVLEVQGEERVIELRGKPGVVVTPTPIQMTVSITALRDRHYPSFAFGERMEGHISGHCIEAVAVADRKTGVAPLGLWEGRIEGYSVTPHCADPDLVWRQAAHCLESGDFRRLLEAGIQKLASRRPGGWEVQVNQLRRQLELAPHQGNATKADAAPDDGDDTSIDEDL